MSYQVSWYVPDRVILDRVEGDFTLDQIKAVSAEIKAFLEQGKAPVHVIADVRDLKEFPRSLNQIKGALDYLRHPSMGWQIVVGHQNPIVRFIASAVSQIVGVNMRMVDTLEEAMITLSKVDTELVNPSHELADVK